jgi:Ca2+/Na+ antiporter
MLQRIQTIWLLLAAICAFATLKFSFYSGLNPTSPGVYVKINGMTGVPVMITTIAVGIIACITIFLYNNRPLQQKLCLLGIVLQVLQIVLLFNQSGKFEIGTFSLTSIIYVAVLMFFFFAFKGIRHDEKIVKESNRLR